MCTFQRLTIYFHEIVCKKNKNHGIPGHGGGNRFMDGKRHYKIQNSKG